MDEADGAAQLQVGYRADGHAEQATLPGSQESSGLRTLRHILEESGGSIRRDPGAAFTLSLPLA